jgi:hypothetical protein
MRNIPFDTKIGLVLVIFFVFVLFAIVPQQIDMGIETESSPKVYPQILIGVIIALSMLMIVGSLKKTKPMRNESKGQPASVIKRLNMRVIIMIGTSVIYIWVGIPWLGFLVSSIILVAFLTWYSGYTNRLITISIAAILPIIIYYIFKLSLHISLPMGKMFQ